MKKSSIKFVSPHLLFFCSIVIGSSTPCFAQTPIPANASSPEVIKATETFEDKLIRKNIELSQKLDGYAEEIDLYLIGKRVSKRKNESSVRLENSSYFRDGEGLHNTSNVNANLRLPNVEDYWQLKFTSYDENEERRNVRRGYLRQTPRQRNYGASLGLFRSFGPVKTKFVPRVELQNPLKISHSLSFETTADVQSYKVSPQLEFFANPDKGTGVFGALTLSYVLSKIWNFNILTDGEYQESGNLYTSNTGFTFAQAVSEKSGLSYSLFFNSNNHPNYHLEAYTFSCSWSHIIYNKILEYDVIPFLEFVRSKEFRGHPGLTVNIDFIF